MGIRVTIGAMNLRICGRSSKICRSKRWNEIDQEHLGSLFALLSPPDGVRGRILRESVYIRLFGVEEFIRHRPSTEPYLVRTPRQSNSGCAFCHALSSRSPVELWVGHSNCSGYVAVQTMSPLPMAFWCSKSPVKSVLASDDRQYQNRLGYVDTVSYTHLRA